MGIVGSITSPLRRVATARWFQPLVKIIETDLSYRAVPLGWFQWLIPDANYRILPLDMRLTDPLRGIYTAEFRAPIGGRAYFFVNDILLPQYTDYVFDGIRRVFDNAMSHKYFYDNNQGTGSIELIWCRPNDCPPYENL